MLSPAERAGRRREQALKRRLQRIAAVAALLVFFSLLTAFALPRTLLGSPTPKTITSGGAQPATTVHRATPKRSASNAATVSTAKSPRSKTAGHDPLRQSKTPSKLPSGQIPTNGSPTTAHPVTANEPTGTIPAAEDPA